ncbi:MAG: universal stress protein [Flavobacteriales bacterium]|nr:universal stress protein [Flavobacteriales bacterium]
MSYSKILIAVEELPLAEKVFKRGVSLAKGFNAEIGIVHVVNIPTSVGSIDAGILPEEAMNFSRKAGENLLKNLIDGLDSDVSVKKFLPIGSPVDEVASVAEEFGADLLIVGTHARSGFSKFFLGSVEEQIVSQVKCEVLVVKGE